jgi:hypothetical protein
MKTSVRFALLLLLALLPAACGRPTAVGGVAPPSVQITAPSNGQQVREGEQVAILFSATDAVGVARVEVGVDSVLLGTATNPSPAANVPFSAQQTWTASTPGSHSVMAIAYNTAGVASSPAVVNVTVVAAGAGSPPPPPPTTAPGQEVTPTPTWTPIAVATEASPQAPSPSSPTPTPTSTPTTQPAPTTSTRLSCPGPITGFESFGTWKRGDQPHGTFTQSAEQVHGGAHAGKLAYDFPTGGNDFVVFLQTHKLGGQPNQISAWVYGNSSKHYLNVWIQDAAGETWQFPLGQVQHAGWKQMTAWLDPASAWPAGHIAGSSNGAIDYPIAFRGLVLDDIPDAFTGSGAIYVDDLSCGQASAPPPAAPTHTPVPPGVSFRADAYTITSGNCTWLRWDVDNVREVYLDGQGVVGHDQRQVCPNATTTYTLRVVRLDGAEALYPITITVVAP